MAVQLTKAKGKKRKVLVGRQWTRGEIGITRERRLRMWAAACLGVLFSALLVGYWLHAIINGDDARLDNVFNVVQLGILAAAAWAFGPRLLKMVSGVRFQDPDEEEK